MPEHCLDRHRPVRLAGFCARLVLLEPDDGRVFLGELLLDAVGTKGSGGNEERREDPDG